MAEQITRASIKCQICCRHNAYYQVDDKYLCGLHSRGLTRKILPNPNKKEKIKQEEALLLEHQKTINQAKDDNLSRNIWGHIILHRMARGKKVPLTSGYLNIFPNYHHRNRKDGFSLPQLSPMSLGPVEHGHSHLPPAHNLENFYQSTKVFLDEIDNNGHLLPIFHKKQMEMFLDETPREYKYEKLKDKPVCFAWHDHLNREYYLDNINSRQFYCNFYERLVRQQKSFNYLFELMQQGYNLQICGYDAFAIEPLPGETWNVAVERHYLNPEHPFGHERILFTMLILTSESYPWIKYQTFNF